MAHWRREAILLKILKHSLEQTVEHPFLFEVFDEEKNENVKAFYHQGFLKELAKVQPEDTSFSFKPMKDGRFVIYNDLRTVEETEKTIYSLLRKLNSLPKKEPAYHSRGLIKDLSFLINTVFVRTDSSGDYVTDLTYWGSSATGFYYLPVVITEWLQEFVSEPIKDCI